MGVYGCTVREKDSVEVGICGDGISIIVYSGESANDVIISFEDAQSLADELNSILQGVTE